MCICNVGKLFLQNTEFELEGKKKKIQINERNKNIIAIYIYNASIPKPHCSTNSYVTVLC